MRKYWLILLLISSLLTSGCLPAAFVAGATAGGAIISDRRTIKTIVKDNELNCKALMRLNAEPGLKERAHICVATFNGVVLLTGEAQTLELKQRACELVTTLPYLRRVNNEIQVAEPLNGNERSLDLWITTKVKTAMIAEKGLNSTQIKVMAENTIVYLMGLVTHEQAEIAVNVARQVSGVSKVVTLFEYTR